MLVDHRTYTCRPGMLQKHLDLYLAKGREPQVRHLGQPLVFLITESGELNSYIHIWVYEDAADRARRRAAMMADPQWQAYLAESNEAGYLIRQETRLMTPAPFTPLPAKG